MKHNQRSASPCELAYSIDDPPRPVSTPENNSTEGVYLTIARNTQPGARIGCGAPHLSDHPTQEAKQQSNSDHGRSVVCSDHHPGATFLTLNSAFCLFAVRPSFQEHTQNTVRHNGNTIKTQSRHSQKHNGNTMISSENTMKHNKHNPFFHGESHN